MSNKDNNFLVKVNDIDFLMTEKEIEELDIVKKSSTEIHLIKDHRSVKAGILDMNVAAGTVTVEINGEKYSVVIKDELHQMLDKMGFNAAAGKHIKEIKAPMPGLVLDIAVKPGQEVKEGEKLLILEAMKMENSIMIQSAATIKNILVVKGQAVEKGQLLIELE